jgi:hypothetical protein
MSLPFSADFFDSLAFQIMRSQRLGLPHITRALVFQGLDAMAFASGRGGKLTRESFIAWSAKYMSFPEPLPITPEELFKSRQKHLPALKKRVALRGAGRAITFVDDEGAPEVELVGTSPVRIHLRTDCFADAFLLAMTSYMLALKQDVQVAKQVARRLEQLPFSWRAPMSVLADEMRLRELPEDVAIVESEASDSVPT